MKRFFRQMRQEFCLLMASVPAGAFTLFTVSVVCMNLMANKSINMPVKWLALDGGIFFSWIAFMSMDMLTKHFGPRAATQLSVAALGLNLVVCGLLFVVSRVPGMWGEAYVEGSETMLCAALDNTFGGTWYVLLGSSVAFLVSALVNNFSNALIGKRARGNGFGSYALRAYVSTALGQLVDNLTFALLVSHVFFGWTLTQCLMCAVTGMAAELLTEVIFSYLGYRVTARWQRQGVGAEYFRWREKKGETRA